MKKLKGRKVAAHARRQAAKEEYAPEPAGWKTPLVAFALLVLVVATYVAVTTLSQKPSAAPVLPSSNGQPEKPASGSAGQESVPAQELKLVAAAALPGTYEINITKGSDVNITGASLNGVAKEFAVGPGGSGSTGLSVYDDSMDCSGASASASLSVNYTVNGTPYSQEAQITYAGCEQPGAGSGEEEAIPVEICKGEGEPCFGEGCCGQFVCSQDSHVCEPLSQCAAIGASCESAACCAGSFCGANSTCVSSSCGDIGSRCESAAACCQRNPPLVCRDMECRFCSSEGEVCTQDSDCCQHELNLVCVNRACVPS